MAAVEYRMNLGRGSAVEQLQRADETAQFLMVVGERAAAVARRYAERPATIVVRPGTGWRGRRAVDIVNTARFSLIEEYGPKGWPHRARRPLRNALDAIRAAERMGR